MKYKKIILTLALGTLVTIPSFSQLGNQRKNLAIGFNGGLNLSSVDFQPTIKQTDLNGMTLGVTARYMSEKYFKMMCGIQTEINYSQRGWEEKIEDGSGNTFSKRMNYLEVLLLAHLAFGKDALDKGSQFFINIGPSIAFLISEKEQKGGGIWNDEKRANGTNEQYDKDTENKFDYGLLGGMGVELNTKAGHFLLEGRYYFGLGDFYKNSKKDFFSRSAHQYIGARVTYLFDLTK